MAIAYTIKTFSTDEDGQVNYLTTLNDVNIKNIRYEQTVGDEMWLESGELTIETNNEIVITPSFADWIGLYINDILTEVFSFRQVEYDEKYGKYTYNLYPIQKTFITDISNTLVVYSTDSFSWNYNLSSALAAMASFSVLDGDGNTQTGTLVSGFQPLKMIKAMLNQHNDYGYYIYATNFDGSTITATATDKGTLIRGTGVLTSESFQNKLNKTFSTDGTTNFDINWFQIFKIISLSYNAYIKITPFIDGFDVLGITIDITPRENVSAGSAISDVVFSERVKINNKYQIDGVLLTGENFEYKLSNWQSPNTYERDIEIHDYTEPEADYAIALYYQGTPAGTGPPWFSSGGDADAYYSGLVSTGHGYEGKCAIIYNDGAEKLLKVLDQVTFSGTNIMITRLKVGVSELADYEGIII
jgi:hypothetical protein